MNVRTFSEYDYRAIRNAAISRLAEQIDIDTLGAWFERFGEQYWNGEYYDADEGKRLFPVYEWDEDSFTYAVTGYEFR